MKSRILFVAIIALVLFGLASTHAHAQKVYAICAARVDADRTSPLAYSNVFETNLSTLPGKENDFAAFLSRSYAHVREQTCQYDTSIPVIRYRTNNFIHGGGKGNAYLFVSWTSDGFDSGRVYPELTYGNVYKSFQIPDRNN